MNHQENPVMQAIRTVFKAALIGLIAAFMVLLTLSSAHATGKPHTPPPQSWDQNIAAQADAAAQASAEAAAKASATGGAASVSGVQAGGGTGGSVADHSRSSLYVFPPPSQAAPLPATICPKGDSLAWSIGWGLFSYAVSSTRTELDCLERWAAVLKAQTPAAPQPTQFLLAPPVPAAPAAVPVEPPKPAGHGIVPKKVSATKPKPAAPRCADGGVPMCTPKPQPKT